MTRFEALLVSNVHNTIARMISSYGRLAGSHDDKTQDMDRDKNERAAHGRLRDDYISKAHALISLASNLGLDVRALKAYAEEHMNGHQDTLKIMWDIYGDLESLPVERPSWRPADFRADEDQGTERWFGS